MYYSLKYLHLLRRKGLEQRKELEEWYRLMYRTYNDGIESVKRRQWAVTNYVLLIFAAIIGFANLFMVRVNDGLLIRPYAFLPLFLLLIAFLISVAGIYHLTDMHRVITEYRYTFGNIIRMSTYAKQIDPIKSHDLKFWKYFFSFTLFFTFLIIVGFLLVGIFLNLYSTWTLDTYELTLIDIILVPALSPFFYWRAEKFKKDLDEKHKL
jgi:hypothetical protein